MKRKMAVAAGILAAFQFSAQAHADTIDDLLTRLLAKGILTQSEYNELAKRKATEPAAPIVTATSQGAPSGSEGQAQGLAAPPAAGQATPAAAFDPHIVTMADTGVGVKLGPVSVKLSGSVNGFYTHDSGSSPSPEHTVTGGLATVGSDSSAIRNGLLPGFLKVDVTTNQDGFDVGAHFGLWPGIDSVTGVGGANSAGNPTALGSAGIDARQVYLTVGRSDLGELKIGRDLGLFASDAILDDITLLGVGTAAANAAPSNTSIGRIGVGYIYSDFQPQITYTSPLYQGLQAAVGIFQPLVTAGVSEVNSSPGVQAKLSYDVKADSMTARFWADVITQKHDATATTPSYTGSGFDLGSKLTFGPASLVGYYYDGAGLGTTGLFILSTDAVGHKRDSDGFYIQGTYTFFKKWTLGASYGKSSLDLAKYEVDPTLLKSNSSYIFQSRYALTSWFSFVGEYTHTMSQAHGGDNADSDTLAMGGILLF